MEPNSVYSFLGGWPQQTKNSQILPPQFNPILMQYLMRLQHQNTLKNISPVFNQRQAPTIPTGLMSGVRG